MVPSVMAAPAMMAASSASAPSTPQSVAKLALQAVEEFFQKGGKGGLFFFCQPDEEGAEMRFTCFFDLGGGFLAFFGEEDAAHALVGFILAALDQPGGFEFVQEFGEGRRAHVEHFDQLALVDAVPLAQEGDDASLSAMGA